MNYIITGGTGFIGTHLANLIKEWQLGQLKQLGEDGF